MNRPAMKEPNADHPITIVPNPRRVRVRFNGKVVAETRRALSLAEASYPPVQYIPRADVDMSAFVPSDHQTYCPFKGDASYFTLEVDGARAANAVWSYVEPYPAVASIKEHVAFYPSRVDAIEES
jgi:uncharacterized protein (DUF427 family)